MLTWLNSTLWFARYELQLPSKEKIRDFLMRENGKFEHNNMKAQK